MLKQLIATVLGGVGVALLVPLLAGCSSLDGCRTCRKEPSGPTLAPAVPVATRGGAGPALSSGPSSTPTAALPYDGQKTCPVTGEELGSMGKPVAVALKGETVYVCCRGCAAKARETPDETLAAVAADRRR